MNDKDTVSSQVKIPGDVILKITDLEFKMRQLSDGTSEKHDAIISRLEGIEAKLGLGKSHSLPVMRSGQIYEYTPPPTPGCEDMKRTPRSYMLIYTKFPLDRLSLTDVAVEGPAFYGLMDLGLPTQPIEWQEQSTIKDVYDMRRDWDGKWQFVCDVWNLLEDDG